MNKLHPAANARKNRRWDVLLTLLFFAVCLALMLRHEMWRDEIHHWKIVTDNPSPAAILRVIKYEGHPFLWHALLFPFARISSSPLMMQAVHLLVASLAAFLFLRRAPFTRLQKILFVFGYFPLYEYGVISRNYALGFVFLFLFCSLYPQRRSRFPLLALLLALSANTSIHALIIVLAVSLGLLVEFLTARGAPGIGKIVLGYAVILAGVALALWVMIPPPDSGNVIDWNWQWHGGLAKKVAAAPALAHLPIPPLMFHFWNSSLLAELGLPAAGLILISALILLYGILLFKRKREVLLIYLTGTAGLLGFFYLKYYGYMRHHGFLYMLLIICGWLCLSQDAGPDGGPPRRTPGFGQVTGRILTALLAVQLLAGLAAGGMDTILTFSQGKVAARFIKAHGLDRLPIIGDLDFACTTISGYLDKKIYYPRARRWGSFVIWDTNRTRPVSEEVILETARKISLKSGQSCLIILNAPLKGPWTEFTKLRMIGRTKEAVVVDESYVFYLLPYSRSLKESFNRQLIPFLKEPD